VGVSEGAFFILIDGIKKALDLTRLRGAFRGVEPRSYWIGLYGPVSADYPP